MSKSFSFSETVGERSEIRWEVEVEWRIAEFFSLSAKVDESYFTDCFYLFGAYWYLRIFPNGESSADSKGWIGLYVRKETLSPLFLTFSFSLKSADGRREKTTEYAAVFYTSGVGKPRFFSRSDLEKRKSKLAPSGVLTIVCTLRYNGPNVVRRIEKLSQDMEGLLLSGDDSDVTVHVKGEEFRLHRSILGARSPVFHSMFRQDMKEKTSGVVSIDDCEAETFRKFADSVYTGRVDKLSPEIVFGLYEVADKYRVSELKKDCLDYVMNTLSVDWFCEAVDMAQTHDEKELMDRAMNFLSNKMVDIMGTVKWLDFLKREPARANELLRKALMKKKKRRNEYSLEKEA